ncbi:host attachment protein [Phenylobacterium sp.]|uniref:host attachment protein n=1 Tax=Phenylobacterium sp. TaxID=1871053 RepID=UPI00391AB91A
MELGGTTWIVAADGAEARVFEERVRAGEVREVSDFHMKADGHDWPTAHRHPATAHESAGFGRHGAGGRDPADEAERRFLRRVAAELDAAAARKAFDSLVIMAPPRALGVLKAELTPALARKLEASEAHERVGEGAEAIRHHLRDLRARA